MSTIISFLTGGISVLILYVLVSLIQTWNYSFKNFRRKHPYQYMVYKKDTNDVIAWIEPITDKIIVDKDYGIKQGIDLKAEISEG